MTVAWMLLVSKDDGGEERQGEPVDFNPSMWVEKYVFKWWCHLKWWNVSVLFDQKIDKNIQK